MAQKDFAGAWPRVMSRGVRKESVLEPLEHAGPSVHTLGERALRPAINVHAHAVMSNHQHSLLHSVCSHRRRHRTAVACRPAALRLGHHDGGVREPCDAQRLPDQPSGLRPGRWPPQGFSPDRCAAQPDHVDRDRGARAVESGAPDALGGRGVGAVGSEHRDTIHPTGGPDRSVVTAEAACPPGQLRPLSLLLSRNHFL